MLHSLQETKCDASLLLLLLQLLRQRSSNKNRSTSKKQHSSSTRTAPKRVDYISVTYNKFLYANMPYTYATVNGDITISY